MIYMWFTGINHYKLAFKKDLDTIWKPSLKVPIDPKSVKVRNACTNECLTILNIDNLKLFSGTRTLKTIRKYCFTSCSPKNFKEIPIKYDQE